MSLIDELRHSCGFHITQAFMEDKELVNACAQQLQPLTALSVYNILLARDLRRHHGALTPYFPADSYNATLDFQLPTNDTDMHAVVLQIVAMANINQPGKHRDEDIQPRLLAITLSDGHNKMLGIEFEMLHDISISKCAPGCKLLYRGGRVRKGKVLLTSTNCSFLGGEVPHILEAWQADKNAKHMRSLGFRYPAASANGDQPPKFEVHLRSDHAATASFINSPASKQDNTGTVPSTSIETAISVSAAIASLPIPISLQSAARLKTRGAGMKGAQSHHPQHRNTVALEQRKEFLNVSQIVQQQQQSTFHDDSAERSRNAINNHQEIRRYDRHDKTHSIEGNDDERINFPRCGNGGRGSFGSPDCRDMRCSGSGERGFVPVVEDTLPWSPLAIPAAADFPALPPSLRPHQRQVEVRQEMTSSEGRYASSAAAVSVTLPRPPTQPQPGGTVGLGDYHFKIKSSKNQNKSWTCACCTFMNNPQMSYCEMCESTR